MVDESSGRQRILDEAARLFLERGYAEASLRDIAEAVGVRAATIYHHFESKDALLGEVLDRGIDLIADTLDTALAAAATLGPPERLAVAIEAHLSALYEHGPYTTAHVGVFLSAPAAVRRAGAPARDAYERRWGGLLDELASAGLVAPDIDLGVARRALLGMMNATIDWYRPDGPSSVEDVSETLATLALGGLLGRVPTPEAS